MKGRKRHIAVDVFMRYHYDEVDPDVVWDIIQTDLPQLLAMIEPLLFVEE